MYSIWNIIRDNKFKSSIILGLTLVISYITYLVPIFQSHIINTILPNNDTDKLAKICLMLGVLVIIQFICTYKAHVLVVELQYLVVNKLKLEYVNTIKKMDENIKSKWTIAELQAKFEEINKIVYIVSLTMFKLVGSILVAIAALCFLFPISPMGTILLLMIMPVCYIINVWSLEAAKNNIRDVAEANIMNNYRFTDFITNLSLFKLNLIDNECFEQFSVDIKRITNKQILSAKSQLLAGTIITNFHSIVSVLFYFIFGLSVINKNLSIGEYVAAMQYIHLVYKPITLYAGVRLTISPALVSSQRTIDFIKQNKIEAMSAKSKVDGINTVEILRPNYKSQINYELTCYVTKGDHLILNGTNGSGKSTILKILIKQYPIDSGQILINDIDIIQIDQYFLWSHIHYVNQSPQIFNGTILDNIILNNKDNKKMIDFYIKKYDLFHLSSNIEWNRVITSKNDLSLGEQKQIQIFRLLLSNKDLYLIDELEASLDKSWKEKLERIINDKKKDSIVISIEHK